MTDIALVWDNENGLADFAIVDGDLAMDKGLWTSVLLSLFCDRLADPSDVIPDGGTDRRGWWGDTPPEGTAVDPLLGLTGSKLWLLAGALQVQDTLNRAQAYAQQALAWLTADKVADSVTVTASFPRRYWLLLNIAIKQGNTVTPYDIAWSNS